MDPLSNYCKLTLHDTSNYCQFCAILDPRIFKKFSRFSVLISSSKTNTNTSLHCATWCNFRARTWQSKFIIGENNFWRKIHIYSLICKFKICIYLKLRPFEMITASYGSCKWSLLVSIHCAHTTPLCEAWISNGLSFEFLDAIVYFKIRMQL